jgi:hypothetical protein
MGILDPVFEGCDGGGRMSVDLVLHFDPRDEVLAAARACEADVFLAHYGNTAEQWEDEYGPYDPNSAFVAITEPGGDALAAMRIILPNPYGLKSVADVARAPWSIDGARAARAAGMVPAQTWDVATIALRSGASRGGLLTAALYRALLLGLRANGARWIVMIMDVRARRVLNMVGLKTQILPGATIAPYLGSGASVPLWAEVTPMVDYQRRESPDAYRLITQGVGMDGIRFPAPAQFALADRVLDHAVSVSANRIEGLATV